MVAIAIEQYKQLKAHMVEKDHKMHLRKACYRSNERTLHYATIMYSNVEGRINCHTAGPTVDFEFDIIDQEHTAVFQITRNSGSFEAALKILEMLKKEILNRVENDNMKSFRRTKEGQYYINRENVGRMTPALKDALAEKVFPEEFAKNLINWGYIVIKGRAKKI